ncbi:hypothetical protein ACFL20_12025 [Spirochaetota bacterium]
MNLKINRNLNKLLVLSLLLAYSCSSINSRTTFTENNIKKIKSTYLEKSKEKIDNETTYEVYFKLQKQVECIKVIISSSYEADKFYHKRKYRKVYFVVEKVINLSHFNKLEKKNTFFELGKNYNKDWFSRSEIIICSPVENPIMKLDEKSNYRIRFTTFSAGQSDLRINIKANCKITFTSMTK